LPILAEHRNLSIRFGVRHGGKGGDPRRFQVSRRQSGPGPGGDGGRPAGAAPRDLLASPADLDRWLVAADLAQAAPGATEGNLVQARSLREALYRLALSRAEGAALPDADRELLNGYAALPAAPPRLDADGRARLSGDVRGLLANWPARACRCWAATFRTASASARVRPARCCSSTPRARAIAAGAR
jgi:hypothetical protein